MKLHVLVALFVVSWGVAWMPASSRAEGDAAAGKALFDANCASCHGVSGKGDGPVGAALTPAPRDFTLGVFAFDADDNGVAGEDQVRGGGLAEPRVGIPDFGLPLPRSP